VKELRHDGEDSLEMAGTATSLPLLGEDARVDRYDGWRRVHAVVGRRKEDVHASTLCQLRVFLEGTWVALEVLTGPELQRIDEDAHHHQISATLRFVNQGQMALVQRAHGRHERDPLSIQPRLVRGGDHLLNRVDRAHYWKL
jgi:hypothetical protein